MNEKDFAELSAAAALGALAPDEQRAFEAELALYPEREAILRDDLDAASRLAALAPPVAPPPAIRDALLARIAAESVVGDEPDSARTAGTDTGAAPEVRSTDAGDPAAGPAKSGGGAPFPSADGALRGPRRWFILAASVVLLLAVGFGAVTIGQQLNRSPAVMALQEIQQAPDASSASIEMDGVEATAHWSGELGQAVLVSDGLPELADDETFELWFVREDGAVPAGTFAADGGEATALLTAEMQAGDVIAVTVEPAGGSPTGAPSGDPLIAIPTA